MHIIPITHNGSVQLTASERTPAQPFEYPGAAVQRVFIILE